jgi:hypothetical protein
MIRTLFALAGLLAAAFPVHAQVYKCVEGSRTVYSQIPCPADSQSTTIRRTAPSTPAPGTAKDGGPKTATEQEQAFRKRQQEQQDAAKKDSQKVAEAKERQENCAMARQQVAQYEAGGRITRTDEKGERSFLDDQEIESAKARARERVALWCK